MNHDLILAGGGLANGLIAWRLRQVRPELNILCLEEQPQLGGNHTWSFHDGDLSPAQHHWIEPLVVKRWPSYQVHFAQRSRVLDSGYASVTSERFAEVIAKALGETLRTGQQIVELGPQHVRLADGQYLTARAVIDGRGARHSDHLRLGHQAFLGQLLQLRQPHGLVAPVIMDARVDQGDGYRFVYVLPFSADTVLVEDTHYVDRASLSVEQLREHIAQYVQWQGWQVAKVIREEQGVLPITLAGNFDAYWNEAFDQPVSGLRAGLFHCTTGYSLPSAVRLAEWLAAQPLQDARSLHGGLREYARSEWRRQRFYRLLNRLLFLAGRPQDRWTVMQRFYGLSEPLISRFYAGQSSLADKARVLMGKPPVPLGEALRAAAQYAPQTEESRS